MTRPGRHTRRDERGMVLLVVLVVLTAVTLGSATMMMIGTTDVRMAGAHARSTKAFYACEAGVMRALVELEADAAWTGTSETLSNGSAFEVSVTSSAPSTKYRVRSEGRFGGSERVIEYRVAIDRIADRALFAGKDLDLRGTVSIAGDGARAGGDAYIDLDDGSTAFTLYLPGTSGMYVNGDVVVTRTAADAVDVPAMRLTSGQWLDLRDAASPSYLYDSDGDFLTGDTDRGLANPNFAAVQPGSTGHRAIVVDGDVTLSGTVSGTGNIVASGDVTFDPAATSNGAVVGIVAGGDVTAVLSGGAAESFTLYVYAEGNVQIAGGVSFTGMVVSLGSVSVDRPSGFQAMTNAAQWESLSPAYAMVAAPLRHMSWEEPGS